MSKAQGLALAQTYGDARTRTASKSTRAYTRRANDEERRQAHNEQVRDYLWRRRALGLCYRCGEPNDNEPRWRCLACNEKQAAYQRARTARLRAERES